MATRQDVDDLLERTGRLPVDPSRREETRQAIADYLQGLLDESGGELTPQVLTEADRLYDMGAIATIKKVLGLTQSRIEQALGKEVPIQCYRCHHTFTAFRPRCKGGYRYTRPEICPDCVAREEKARQQQHAAWRTQSAARQTEEAKKQAFRVEVEQLIMTVPDPHQVVEFQGCLKKFLEVWTDGEAYWYDGSEAHNFDPTCMVCGSRHRRLRLFVSNRRSDCRTLWRWNDPRHYFANTPHLPLVGLPLLILCDECEFIVQDTHREITF